MEKKKYRILRLIKEKGGITRRGISENLKINLSKVSSLCRQLLDKKFLIEEASSESKTGRKAAVLKLNPVSAYTVGIEISSRAIRGILMNLAGQVVEKREGNAAAIGDREKMLEEIFLIGKDLCNSARGLPVAGIGVGIAGIVDKNHRISLRFPHMENWQEVDLGTLLEREFGLDILVENQVRCAALGELHFGAGREFKNFLYLHIGRGIGLGVVIDRRIYAGTSNSAGELGHILVKQDGPICYCGNYGCLESLASPPAIEEQYIEAVKKGVNSNLANGIRNGEMKVSIEKILEVAGAGERLANTLLENAASYIGTQTANLVNLFNPEALIFSGILAENGRLLLEVIERVFRLKALPALQKVNQFKVSELGDEACCRGAAAFVFDELFDRPGQLLKKMSRGK